MAGNIQLIFYQKEKGNSDDVLVKFLLNEQEATIPIKTDHFPFYKWGEVKRFYTDILSQ